MTMSSFLEFLWGQKFGLLFAVATFLYSLYSGKKTEKKHSLEIENLKKENTTLHQENKSLLIESNLLNEKLSAKMDIDREIDTTPLNLIFEKITALRNEDKDILAQQYLERLSFNSRVLKTSKYWFGLGALKYAEMQFSDSLIYFKRAEELTTEGQNIELYVELGKVYSILNQFDNATVYIEKALKIDPEDFYSLIGKAQIQLLLHEVEEAEIICKKLEKKGIKHSDLYALRATILTKRGEHQKAIHYYESAIQSRILPSEELYINLSLNYSQIGDFDNAFDVINEGIIALPNKVNLFLQKAYLLMLAGNYFDEAINIYEAKIVETNKNIIHLSNYTVCLFYTGSYDKACQHYEELNNNSQIPNQNNTTSIHKNIGSPLFTQSNFNLINYFNTVGLCYQMNNKFHEALQLYKLANSIQPNDLTYTNLSKLFIDFPDEGNFETAEYYIKEGLKFNHENADLYNNYGFLLKLKQKYSEAKEMFRKALQHNPSHGLARSNLKEIEAA